MKVADRDKIQDGDQISWQKADGRRVFGRAVEIRHGIILARSDRGVYITLRVRDVTKECG